MKLSERLQTTTIVVLLIAVVAGIVSLSRRGDSEQQVTACKLRQGVAIASHQPLPEC